MTRVLLHEAAYQRVKSRLDALGVDLVLMGETGALRLNGVEVALPDAQIDAGWVSADVFTSAARRDFFVALLKSPTLKWLQSAGAGFDNPVFAQLMQRGVQLSTSHGQALSIAEYVMAAVLDHFKRGDARRTAQAEGKWRRISRREVFGTRWLVIGFGSIGQGVAARAQAFGARIAGVRRDMSPHPLAEILIPLERVPEMLPEADVVVLCTPLNDATRGLVDEKFLAAMKPGSVLVNVGRGGLVDEHALLAALDRGVPEHAALDVFQVEPLPADSPFWTHPRVAVSAHDSGESTGFVTRNDDVFLQNLARFAAGEPPANLADLRDAPTA